MSTILFCKRELGIFSDSTIVDWNSYLREVCAETLISKPISIGGKDMSVEIDESLFVRRKYNIGHSVSQQWVFGGICRETKDAFLYSVENRSEEVLLPAIKHSIKPFTTIISDEWKGYKNIFNIEGMSYRHITVNHTKEFINKETRACTNMVESMWAKAKLRNKKQWGTHKTMLDSYLCEYMWRKRLANNDPYEQILKDIVEVYPLQ